MLNIFDVAADAGYTCINRSAIILYIQFILLLVDVSQESHLF